MIRANIVITLKKSVLDPQGITLKQALHSLGDNQVENVRVGKFIQLLLKENNLDTAKTQVERMCQKLLANLVIEEYSYELEAVKG